MAPRIQPAQPAGNTDVEMQNTDVETQNFASPLRITKFCVSAAHYKKGTLFVKSEPRYPFDITA